MKELQVFHKGIIPVYINDKGQKTVLGRELYKGLKIGKDYSTWFKDMCAYGFTEGVEFSPILGETSEKGGRPKIEHLMTLDMAKHIAMIQRTPEGKAIRDQLIALETNIAELSPELRLLIHMEMQQKEQTRALEAVNEKVDRIRDVVALSPLSWRPDARRLISRIAQTMGGAEYIKDVNEEIYGLVNERAGVSLEVRLTNKRRRMADEGVCKSKRDKLSKVDVIADDKKLIEIYLAVVKEMAVRCGVHMDETPGGV